MMMLKTISTKNSTYCKFCCFTYVHNNTIKTSKVKKAIVDLKRNKSFYCKNKLSSLPIYSLHKQPNITTIYYVTTRLLALV